MKNFFKKPIKGFRKMFGVPDMNPNVVLVVMALLIALFIILDGPAAPAQFRAFGRTARDWTFAPAALIIAGYVLGPFGGLVVGALGDIISAIIMPRGAYFPGFTASWAFSGFVFGLLLFRRYKWNKNKVMFAVSLVIASLLSLFVDRIFAVSYWLYHLGFIASFWVVLVNRIVLFSILYAIMVPVMYGVLLSLRKPIDRFLLIDIPLDDADDDDEEEVDDDETNG
ncbi:MAG: folate family ECF transporter S component [Firmicutes bacterium]|nr:folate family ECF transporter S component [Bacillota bacterium]